MTSSTQDPCFHCGEPIPAGVDLSVEIGGQTRSMCCAGCSAVARLIHSSGLGRYYEFRDALPERPDSAAEVSAFSAWDREAVLDYHAPVDDAGVRAIVLVLENVHCAACAWLVHRYLGSLPGVREARLDVSDGRLVA